MPFGTKPDPTGRPDIDFDAVYEKGIRPAIEAVGMDPIRADAEKTGGIIHKPMFERLLLCEYAIADLTTANPDVFYELGVRHTARPSTTLPIFATHQPIPFDVNYLRALPYELGANNEFGATESSALVAALSKRLGQLREVVRREDAVDSPVFQLLGAWEPGDIARLKTDVFRDQVRINDELKGRMTRARSLSPDQGFEALKEIESGLGPLDVQEAGIVVDLMLSYRALSAWTGMISLHENMPEALKHQVLVREQLAFALNRRAGKEDNAQDRSRALEILEVVEDERGPSSETCGLIGRIYKDYWAEALQKDDTRTARGHLKRAISAYLRGFEADSRDAYPGINAVTLLDIRGDERSLVQRDHLVPVVRFAVEQRLRGKEPDYWDHATMLELAVLASDEEAADDQLDSALAIIREKWEPETTARNLRLIQDARKGRGEDTGWLDGIIEALESKAGP